MGMRVLTGSYFKTDFRRYLKPANALTLGNNHPHFLNQIKIIDAPFEDAVRHLFQTPPVKKSKPQKKKA
jgi:hypothetical protein